VPRLVHDFDPPERFVAGTVGQPGERTFYLQARSGRRVTSVALEKMQVAALAERVDQLLDEVVRTSGGSAAVPATVPADAVDNDPLDVPLTEEFRVGPMALGWDADTERLMIEAHEIVEDESDLPDLGEDTEDGPTTLRVRLTGTQARAFAARAQVVVAAGRPPCPFCHLPLDPAGHICPRANGYRRRD
jgi:uncharacterized repeat protein (TIGR03847 family)